MDWAGKSLMELDPGTASASRVVWADIAKALSIILLVIWSLYGLSIYVDHMFILARMPMFFFVSGLFAHGVITRSATNAFFRDKVGNLVYLYVLWTVIWFVSTDLVAYFWWGREIAPGELPAMMWEPILKMWFFYGLAIAFGVAYLCRDAPVWIVFGCSMLAYAVIVAQGDWLDIPFLEKVIRLFPYFWLGLVLRPLVWDMVERHWRLWPVAAAAFLGLAYWVMDSPWQRFAPLTFLVTSVGIAALLGLSAQLARFQWSWILKLIGGSTLYIYATQYITIFYLERAAGFLGLSDYPLLLLVPIVVACGAVLGRFCARKEGLRWLFSAPWAPYKPPARVERPGGGVLLPERGEA